MNMANYLLLFRGGAMATMSPAEMQANMQKWTAWMGELAAKGKVKGGDPLEDSGKVITGSKKLVTDGPFAEAKDLVGGYLLIEATDIDNAVELSRGCPIFERGGSVEVRATRPM
jgi:hypothetical protein